MDKEIQVSKGELKSLEHNSVWRAIVQLYENRKVILTGELTSAENVYDMKKLQGELQELEFFLTLPKRFKEEIDIDELPDEEVEKDNE